MMEKAIVLYRSKYGAAKRYAELFGRELGCEVAPLSHAGKQKALSCETVLLCGGVYAGRIRGAEFFRKHYDALREKKLLLFAVGALPPEEGLCAGLRERNLPGKLQAIPLFYGRGSWDEARLHLGDRALCALLKKAMTRPPDSDGPWAAYKTILGETHTWVDDCYLTPALDHLRRKEE